MLQPTKNKEPIGIIKSGLVGAFAFTGIFFIWVIVSIFQGPRGSVIVTTFMNSPTFDFAKEALIVIVCIGFMLGVLLRRRFSIMQRRFFLLVTDTDTTNQTYTIGFDNLIAGLNFAEGIYISPGIYSVANPENDCVSKTRGCGSSVGITLPTDRSPEYFGARLPPAN